jgi:hypothetical protein
VRAPDAAADESEEKIETEGEGGQTDESAQDQKEEYVEGESK